MSFLNPFTIRKYAALMLPQLITVILFYVGAIFYGLYWGIGFLFVGLLLGLLLGKILLSNPFTNMLEGKGLMCLNMDSTGVLRPFLIGLKSPYIVGKLGKQRINDVFDRSTVLSLDAPRMNSTPAEMIKEGPNAGGIKIILDEKEYNKGRFGFFHWPVLIWNDQIKSIVTKDFLSNQEKDTFAEHGVLYLNRKMEELTSAVRDFGRHVVELTRPKESIFTKWWVWVIIVVFLGILLVMFAPAIMSALGNVGATFQNTAQTATTSVVTPR